MGSLECSGGGSYLNGLLDQASCTLFVLGGLEWELSVGTRKQETKGENV